MFGQVTLWDNCNKVLDFDQRVQCCWHSTCWVKLSFFQKTMASFISKLETWLKCQICEGTVKEPKTLNCFHSFCKSCLRKVNNKMRGGKQGIKCLVCNAFTEKREIKVNSLLCELLEEHKGMYTSTNLFTFLQCKAL